MADPEEPELELRVELLPSPEGPKRRRVEAEEVPEQPLPSPVEEDEDDSIGVVLCDTGPRGGLMSYYLERQWERPALADAEGAGDDAHAGAIVPVDPAAGALVPHSDSRAEVVEQDEGVEATLARIQFQMDFCEMADTPWRQPGANIQDYFNCGLSESEFKEYLRQQIKMRLEARHRRKIGVVDGRPL